MTSYTHTRCHVACTMLFMGASAPSCLCSCPRFSLFMAETIIPFVEAARIMGIRVRMYNFIVEDRTFQVQVGNECSSYRHNWVGVSRGTIICPTLLDIFLAVFLQGKGKLRVLSTLCMPQCDTLEYKRPPTAIGGAANGAKWCR